MKNGSHSFTYLHSSDTMVHMDSCEVHSVNLVAVCQPVEGELARRSYWP